MEDLTCSTAAPFSPAPTALGFLGLTGFLPPAFAQDANARDAALDALLTGWFNEDLRENPGFATALGLDTGALAALRGRLGDNSQAKADADRAKALRRARALAAFGRAGLSPAGQLNYDIAAFRGEVGTIGARFHYGNAGGRPAPYVVSQLGGAYYQVPDFLDTQHPIHNAQDADYYLARLEAFAANLDQETDRIRHDAALHVTPPDFVLDKAIGNLERLRATPAGRDQPGPLARPADRRGPCRRRLCRPRDRPGLRPDRRRARPPDRGARARCGRTRPTRPAPAGCPTARLIMPGACAPTRRRR